MMLKLILALLPLAANVTGQQAAKPAARTATTVSKPAVAKKTTPAPLAISGIQGIPAGAVKVDENTYRFQERDAAGRPAKVWLYRRNPFGVSRIEEKEAAKIGQPSTSIVETPATATDLGDSYRFERPGPFGAKIWFKRKSELNDDERVITERNQATPATQKAAN